MISLIEEELSQIERTEDIRVLLAIESGSRAWGFASPDSDYDVRFVYAHRPKWYLKLEKTRDVIEWKLDDTLDISGWDIQKALRLMRASNPSIMEWLSSPIVYRTPIDDRLIDLAHRSFDPIASCHHYLNMAKHNAREYLECDSVKLKKYFYVIRPILAARHVLAQGTQPPMVFENLMDEYLENRLIKLVKDLLEEKRSHNETLYIARCEPLNSWIRASIADIDEKVKCLTHTDKLPWDEYDALFYDLIQFHCSE